MSRGRISSPQGTYPGSVVLPLMVGPRTWRCCPHGLLSVACSSSQTEHQLSRHSEPSGSLAASPEKRNRGHKGRWGWVPEERVGEAVVMGVCLLLCSPVYPVPHSSPGPPGTQSNVCRSLCRIEVWYQYPPVWGDRQQEMWILSSKARVFSRVNNLCCICWINKM